MKSKAFNLLMYAGFILLAMFVYRLYKLPAKSTQLDSPVTPGTVVSHPHRYFNQEILVEGLVDKSFYAALTGMYRVEALDGKSSIWVLCTEYPPTEGEALLVKGVLKAVYKTDSSNGVVLRESGRVLLQQPAESGEQEVTTIFYSQ